MLTVKDLKQLLENCNDGDVVIIAGNDANDFSPLDSLGQYAYVPDTTWRGQIYMKELTPELIKKGYTEEDVCDDGHNAVVIFPVH